MGGILVYFLFLSLLTLIDLEDVLVRRVNLPAGDLLSRVAHVVVENSSPWTARGRLGRRRSGRRNFGRSLDLHPRFFVFDPSLLRRFLLGGVPVDLVGEGSDFFVLLKNFSGFLVGFHRPLSELSRFLAESEVLEKSLFQVDFRCFLHSWGGAHVFR